MKHIHFLAVSMVLILAMETIMIPIQTALAGPDFSPAYQGRDEGDDDGEEGENYFCGEDSEFDHPVAVGIAELFDTDYEEVMGYFCEGTEEGRYTGFGQIMLAYLTAGDDGDVGSLLSRRTAGEDWGQIWQDQDLIGKPDDAGPPEDSGKPEGAGKPDGVGPGN